MFVFTRTSGGGLQLPTTEDRFPDPRSAAPPATFAPQLFDDPAWQRHDVGPYAVLVENIDVVLETDFFEVLHRRARPRE